MIAAPLIIHPSVPLDYPDFIERYSRAGPNREKAPEMFVNEVLLFGVLEREDPDVPDSPLVQAYPDKWQTDLLRAYGAYRRRIAVKSGHGVGKSAVLSWITIHHVVTEFPSKSALTAPTSKQLYNVLWSEIGKWMNKLPSFVREVYEVKSEMIEHLAAPKECFVMASTSRPESPEALAGVHSDDGSVLLIADEASGIHSAIYESASGSMSGRNATTILAGNPLRTSGLFFDVFGKLADMWVTFTVNCEDCRRVSKDFMLDMAARYGIESNGYRVRVLGQFPRSDEDAIIPYELVAAAQVRDVQISESAPMVWGLDVARFGWARTVLCKRKGNGVSERPKTWSDKDTMQVAALIKIEWDTTQVRERPVEIMVDSIGIGAGVVDRLRELGLPVRGINVSESAAMNEQYGNLKAELWIKAKEWFQALNCVIPSDDPNDRRTGLCSELVVPKYRFTKTTNRILVESKEDIRKRGFDSPDVADAFILTFASMAATLAFGSSYSTAWGQPVRRNIKGVV